ncbi:hypothetical protein HPB49_009985 [Dermacentor silvarum]|uniref:Uncharacterized protein n=1 Tax=Dermacentor silvarum TaxID=543639 RepID=A0ACB8DZ22_DERSI|nr:hypothetical protein HPB49_009985 [Dermacentor silvarum]
MMQVQVNMEDISPEEFLEGNGWCTIKYKTQSNRETAQSNTQNGAHSHTGEGANGNRQRSRQQQRNVKQQVIRNSKMSLLPRSDFKIVIRPRGGLDVATTGTVRLASAIYLAANVPAQEAGEDTVCSNNRQNIIVMSIPHATHAAKCRQLESITIGDRRHEVSSYETAPDYTVKGIIRGIPLEEDAKSIHTNIIHGRNPHAVAAKRLSNTKTVIVAFEGPRVPSYVRAAEEAEEAAKATSSADKSRSRSRTHSRGRSRSQSHTPDSRKQRRLRSRTPRRIATRDTETIEKPVGLGASVPRDIPAVEDGGSPTSRRLRRGSGGSDSVVGSFDTQHLPPLCYECCIPRIRRGFRARPVATPSLAPNYCQRRAILFRHLVSIMMERPHPDAGALHRDLEMTGHGSRDAALLDDRCGCAQRSESVSVHGSSRPRSPRRCTKHGGHLCIFPPGGCHVNGMAKR